MITECCGVAIADDHRFCPKCGYEARVEEIRRTIADHYGAGWLAGVSSVSTCRKCGKFLNHGHACGGGLTTGAP